MLSFLLGTKLVQAVQKEAAMQRPLPLLAATQEEVGSRAKPTHTLAASVLLVDNDRFSHLVEVVTISIEPIGKVSAKTRTTLDVTTKGNRFAQRATYLSEMLQFVETDARGAAILRSTPATMLAPRAEYFEATVSNNTLALKRYQPYLDKPGRTAVPFCLTDETLARLANDAAAVFVPGTGK